MAALPARIHFIRTTKLLFFIALISIVSGLKCFGTGNDALQIHLVPHTHLDVGWLKTVDEYFYGANNSIQHAGVQYILDSVIPILVADPSKRFIYVEIAFLERWWNEQSDAVRKSVKDLVKEGRLEFVNGGWSMNDEACTHYNAIIDQMTYGLKFIEDNFGSNARPRIAWHIDPFGHSAEQASLFSQMSFDGFFFARIDYADKALRVKEQRMEMIWRGSKSLGQETDIFTGVLYYHYNPPPGFCYDQLCSDPPIQDNPSLFDMNVKERVEKFINVSCAQASHYRTSNIMLTMGSDFQYENANMWFKNLDKLIKYANQDGRVNAFYSTPSKYLEALHKANLTWELKTDDLFPYASCPHCYWTGYFTSRPALKGYVRSSNNLLQICKQLEVLGSLRVQKGLSSDLLRRAMAVAQHHDAVTGTEFQHVADDYAKRLATGAVECQSLVADILSKYLARNPSPPIPSLTFCNYLNISSCLATQHSKSFAVIIYNPLARTVNSFTELPVGSSSVVVFGPHGKTVKSQVLPLSNETIRLHQKSSTPPPQYKVLFLANIPPLGFSTYFVKLHKSSPSVIASFRGQHKEQNAAIITNRQENLERQKVITIQNVHIQLQFSTETGRLIGMTDFDSNLNIGVDQQFLWYNSSVGNAESDQISENYIFRPNSSKSFPVTIGNKAKITVYKGPLVQEVRQVFGSYVSQVVRLYTNERSAEFEYTVGPIPFKDNLGKEIITRFDTDIKSNSLFYTDANGREMKERKLNYRPTWKLDVTEPVAGNYYPINSRIYIKDSKRQMTVLTDRSLGGSSLKDGSVEIMIHRRILRSDGGREPLNETGVSGKGLVVRGKLKVILAPPVASAALHRVVAEQMLLPPLTAFSQNGMPVEKWLRQYNSLHSSLTRELPPNVHLLTLETRNKEIVIRLEHQFEVGEDANFSQPIKISFAGIFTDFDIVAMTETNLSANQYLKNKKPLHWNIKTARNELKRNKIYTKSRRQTSPGLSLELSPMQIRTFKLVLKHHDENQLHA